MRYSNVITRSFGYSVLLLAVFLSIVLVNAPTLKAQEDVPLLFVENDERTLELQIKEFLDGRTNWPIELAYFGSGRADAYVKIPFTLEGGHKVDIYVDTLSSASEGKERRIMIYGYLITDRAIGARKKAALLEMLNQHTVDDWMVQRLFLDKDDDIAFAWNINIPGENSPIHAEQVYDAIIRTKFSLDALLPKLKPLGLF